MVSELKLWSAKLDYQAEFMMVFSKMKRLFS